MNIAGKKLSNGDLAIAGGLIVALIAIFLPWYSYSYSITGVPGVTGGFSSSASVGGLSYWSGWFFFIFTLIGIGLFVMRTFVPTVAMPALPVNDAMVYSVIGALMVVMALLWLIAGAPGSVSGPGYSAGLSFGLIIGIVGSAAVIAGGFLKRSDPQPVTKPMSAYQTPTAPPPASPPPPPSV
jgi:hypothetical protein